MVSSADSVILVLLVVILSAAIAFQSQRDDLRPDLRSAIFALASPARFVRFVVFSGSFIAKDEWLKSFDWRS